MPLDRISYPVVEQVKEFTQRGNLFYIDQLMVEVNTRNQVVTPTLILEDLVVTLDTFSTSRRDHIQIEVNRIGSFSRLELSPAANMQWFMVEIVIRPVQLGVGLLPSGGRQQFPGQSDQVSEFLLFDLKPFSIPTDARLSCVITKRIYIDIETGNEMVTPVLLFADGTSQTLPAFTRSTRGVEEVNILASERLVAVRLDGDFTNPDIILYDIEVDMYIPGRVGVGAG